MVIPKPLSPIATGSAVSLLTLTVDCTLLHDLVYSANGTCLPRGCRSAILSARYVACTYSVDRRDEYVLSSQLDENKPIPPMCGEGHFCPDDASACLPLVEVGGRCQLNRDGE